MASPLAPLGATLLRSEVPRIWTVASTWPHYFRLLFFPLDLSVDYAPAVIPLAFNWTGSGILGAVLLLGTLGLALRLWGKQTLGVDRHPPRLFSFGVVWLVITLSPVSNVLFLSGVLLAERTFYLPSVGFVALLAWIGAELYKERRRVAEGALILVLVLMSLRTVTRNATWRNNFTVFDTLMREHPESGRAQWLMGDAQYMVGDRKAGNEAYNLDLGLVHVLHRIRSVQEQVHEHLFQMAGVHQDRRTGFIKRPGVFYLSQSALVLQELAHTRDDFIDPNRCDLVGLGPGEIKKSSHDAIDALCLGTYRLQELRISLARLDATEGDVGMPTSPRRCQREGMITSESMITYQGTGLLP